MRLMKLWMLLSWAVFSISLLGLQSFAGAAAPVMGRVVPTSGVVLEGILLNNEDAVRSGDLLTTSRAASALIRFSASSQADVLEKSSIRFRQDAAGNPLARISYGEMLATAAGKNTVVVETPRYRVEPAKQSKVIYFVGVLPDKSTIVAARQGDVSIREIRSGKNYLLTQGLYIRIDAAAAGLPGQEEEKSQQAPGKAAGQAAPPPPPPKPTKQPWHIGSLSPGASTALVIAAVGGAGGAVAAATLSSGKSASPSAP